MAKQNVPEMFGPFRILEKIGAGSLSDVFFAEDTAQANKSIALKRMRADRFTPELIKIFKRENVVASLIQHLNIVRILGFGSIDNIPYVAMELVKGRSLRQIHSRVSNLNSMLPVPFSLYVVREAALALEALNPAGASIKNLPIAKRNMIPENILITHDGEVKIFGWSIAKIEDGEEVTRPGIIKGVRGYMSPEQARGEAINATSDLYSLGVILWEMLTGQRLTETQEIVSPLEHNDQIPPFVEDLVLRVLAHSKTERPQSARKWADELSAALEAIAPGFSRNDIANVILQIENPSV